MTSALWLSVAAMSSRFLRLQQLSSLRRQMQTDENTVHDGVKIRNAASAQDEAAMAAASRQMSSAGGGMQMQEAGDNSSSDDGSDDDSDEEPHQELSGGVGEEPQHSEGPSLAEPAVPQSEGQRHRAGDAAAGASPGSKRQQKRSRHRGIQEL